MLRTTTEVFHDNSVFWQYYHWHMHCSLASRTGHPRLSLTGDALLNQRSHLVHELRRGHITSVHTYIYIYIYIYAAMCRIICSCNTICIYICCLFAMKSPCQATLAWIVTSGRWYPPSCEPSHPQASLRQACPTLGWLCMQFCRLRKKRTLCHAEAKYRSNVAYGNTTAMPKCQLYSHHKENS